MNATANTPANPDKPVDDSQSTIDALLRYARTMGMSTRVPYVYPLAQCISTFSALVGSRVKPRHERSTLKHPLLPVTIVTEDANLPVWIEMDHTWLHNQTSVGLTYIERLARNKHVLAQRRRQRRMLEMLDPSGDVLKDVITEIMLGSPEARKFGSTRHYSASGPKGEERLPHSLTHLAHGDKAVKRALRELPVMPSERDESRQNHMFWLRRMELERLVRAEGPGVLPRLFPIIICEAITHPPDPRVVPSPLSKFIVEMLHCLRHDQQTEIVFDPGPIAAAYLDEHRQRIGQLVASLPAVHGAGIIPDLAWHHASLLSLICHAADEELSETPSLIVARLSVGLAEWIIRSHIHAVRHLVPADQNGPLDTACLKLNRVLGVSPAPLRDIQRSLRDTRKDDILPLLGRLVAAGAAVEHPDGRFSRSARPAPDLSEIMSEFSELTRLGKKMTS